MNALEVIDIAKDSIFVFLVVAGPIMMISLGVGLVVALFQALTQIQEMTLTFVPKILAIFLSLIFLMPFIITTLTDFTERISERIVNIEQSGG